MYKVTITHEGMVKTLPLFGNQPEHVEVIVMFFYILIRYINNISEYLVIEL